MIPSATYRLQLRREFGFTEAADLAPYLTTIGVSHVYASPIMKARPGSPHGYDVIDPTCVNPELGGEDGLRAFVAALRAHGLGLIVDIVPNHMGVGADNPWWLDVMQRGPASRYAGYFDIDWRPPDPALFERLALPFLGGPYGDVLHSGELKLCYDEQLRSIVVVYHEHRFPLKPESVAALLLEANVSVDEAPGSTALEAVLVSASAPERLHSLLEQQHWRLAWWRTAGDEINWRRFFDIGDLAGVRIDDPTVFESTHAKVFSLYAEALIDGVRIDHVDGLADPAEYLQRLRARLAALDAQRSNDAPAGPAYIIVEKILASDEQLPADWPVDGATGYEFMNDVSALLHDRDGEAALSRAWREISGRELDFVHEEKLARRQLLASAFAAQHAAAAYAFHLLARAAPKTRDITYRALHAAITALLKEFPAYRTYASRALCPPLSRAMSKGFATARKQAGPDAHALDFVQACLSDAAGHDETLWRQAVTRLQQLSAPIAAKAVEDTAFYRYGRLLSRNDVGFDAARLSLAPEEFHARCIARAQSKPHTMLATATHDHKRGEDVRARLAAVSEIPDRWTAAAKGWLAESDASGSGVAPGDAYMLLQTIVGSWPLDLPPEDVDGLKHFADRICAWQTKALREQKLRSSWVAPNEPYEQACENYVRRMLAPHASGSLAENFRQFVNSLASAAAVNGLVQLFLRCTTPGVPDCYQGCERWDFSMVDPDNRRPIDYAARREFAWSRQTLAELSHDWRDGRIKQALLTSLLLIRKQRRHLFTAGTYEPLRVSGAKAEHVLAFLRRSGEKAVICATMRLRAQAPGDALVPPADWWGDTAIELPDGLLNTSDLLDVGALAQGVRPQVAVIFRDLPVALLATDAATPVRAKAHG